MDKLLFAFCILLAPALHGFYTGNPASPALAQGGMGLFNITSGYVYDQIWDQDIVPKNSPDFSSIQKVGDFEMRSNMASLSLILVRRLELYGYFGVSKENIDWKAKIPFTSTEIKTSNHFSYSLGAKAVLVQFSNALLSLDFQYFTLPSSNKVVQKIVNVYMPLEVSSQYLVVKEWQLAAGAAYKLGPLIPYVGGKYSKLRLKVKTERDFPTLIFKNKNVWGLFVGGSISLGRAFLFTGEARFFDESAFSLAVTTSF